MADSLLNLDSLPIVDLRENWRDGFELGFENALNVERFPMTISEAQLLNDTIVNRYDIKVTHCNKSEEKATLELVYDKLGRYKNFWFIDRTFELVLTAGFGASDITLQVRDDFQDFTSQRVYIALTNGDKITRKVNSAVAGSGTVTLTVDALVHTATLADIVEMRFLRLVRFQNDKFRFSYQTNTISEINLALLELPKELT